MSEPTRRDVLIGSALAVPALKLAGCATIDWDPVALPTASEVFPRTPIAGDMGTEHIVIALYVADAASRTLRIWREGRPQRVEDERPIVPDEDGFAKVKVTGLLPGTAYAYTVLDGPPDAPTGRSLIGHFQTLPRPGRSPSMTVALMSCVGLGSFLPDYIRNDWIEPATWPLPEGIGDTLDAQDGSEEDPVDWDLLVHVGDQAYMDRIWEAGGTYRQYLNAWGAAHGGSYRRVFPHAAVIATWDDHEITDNTTVDPWTEDPDDLERIANGQQAWYRVMPIDGDDPIETPIWRSFRWGHTVEIVMLDCRYERQPDPDRRMMSEAQLSFLLDILRDSPCRFVCVCTDKPFANVMLEEIPYPGRDERWQGHETDRARVTDLLDAEGLDHVLFLTGDIHMNYLGTASASGDRTSDTVREVCVTSGNVNPAVNGLAERQFEFKALEPHLPLITFDARAETIRVRFVAADGTTTFDRTLDYA